MPTPALKALPPHVAELPGEKSLVVEEGCFCLALGDGRFALSQGCFALGEEGGLVLRGGKSVEEGCEFEVVLEGDMEGFLHVGDVVVCCGWVGGRVGFGVVAATRDVIAVVFFADHAALGVSPVAVSAVVVNPVIASAATIVVDSGGRKELVMEIGASLGELLARAVGHRNEIAFDQARGVSGWMVGLLVELVVVEG
jgi:hypothetical protein